jgi:phosphopantothenate---cysteine ligase (ATP)
VIGNILQTRKNRLLFVTPTEAYEVTLTKEQTLSGLEIEKPLVADVVSTEHKKLKTIEHIYQF